MSKVVNTINAFLATDYNGAVVDYSKQQIASTWNGPNFSDCDVGVNGNTISCGAHQRLRVTPVSLEFNKSLLTVINRGNNTFFVRNFVANTLTPIRLRFGNVSCVGTDGATANQIPNSLVEYINNALAETGNPLWGNGGGFHAAVVSNNSVLVTGNEINPTTNYIGNIFFEAIPANSDIVFIRDTTQSNGFSSFNSSAHQLMGGFLNEVRFSAYPPPAVEINALHMAGTAGIITPTLNLLLRPPCLMPLDHIYLRSRSLLPNGLAQMANGANLSSGCIQTDIICRIPYNSNTNNALAGRGGMNFNEIGTTYPSDSPPNVISAYSGDGSQWMWNNQNGKEFSFFCPTNTITSIGFSLTNFQGTSLYDLSGVLGGSGPQNFKILKNGYGVFFNLKFDILE
jgi:hypothetical protein